MGLLKKNHLGGLKKKYFSTLLNKFSSIIIFITLFLFGINISFAGCEYAGKLEKCQGEINNFVGENSKYLYPGLRIKSVKDFPCIQASSEVQYFQIALDSNFKIIDKEMYKYLKMLYENKNYYFGTESFSDYFNALTDLYLKKIYFREKYYKSCEISYKQTSSCLTDEEGKLGVSIEEAKEFLTGDNSGNCYALTNIKLEIFNEAFEYGGLLNKKQTLGDQRKIYITKQQEEYGNVSNIANINYSFIERLWKKWSSKTKHTYDRG